MIECSDGIGAAAYACKDCIRELAFFFQHLLFDFFGDNCLEITDNSWERMGAHNRTKYVVGVSNSVGPLAHGFGYGILQGCSSRGHRMDFGTKETHFVYV